MSDNQCQGCQAGWPKYGDMHEVVGSEKSEMQVCSNRQTRTVMMPREITEEDATAIQRIAEQKGGLDVFFDLYNVDLSSIVALYNAAVELLGE